MENNQKNSFVSIIIACRNEEKYIGKCLESILKNDYPINKLEIIIVDGISTDNTIKIVKNYKSQFKNLVVFNNLKKTTPYAVNIGLNKAKGEYMFWLSAHSTLAKNYIQISVNTMQKYRADSVGGLLISKTIDKSSLVQSAMSHSLNSPFGSGNATFRNQNLNNITQVDTSFGQCFDKNVIKKFGLLNESLTRCQDFEYNHRIIKNGGKILLNPKLKSYYSSPTTLTQFMKKAFTNGYWVIMSDYFSKKRFHNLRHYTPFLFVFSIIILLISSLWIPVVFKIFIMLMSIYIIINLIFSISSALINKNYLLLPVQFIVFILFHLSYGIGSLSGLFGIFINSLNNQHA